MKLAITDTGRAWLLTGLEWQVLGEIALGRNIKAIADLMDVTPKAIEWHLAQIYRKTGYSSHVELCRFAIRIQLIDP